MSPPPPRLPRPPACPTQAVYTVGLLTLMVYYAHFRLWPVFYPMAFEFSCLLYLTGLKIYYEVSSLVRSGVSFRQRPKS